MKLLLDLNVEELAEKIKVLPRTKKADQAITLLKFQNQTKQARTL